MSTDRQNRQRLAAATLVILLLAALGLTFIQAAQIREMRRIDCAASMERTDRIALYGTLIDYWTPLDSEVALAYNAQRESVTKAAIESADACE